MDEPEWLDFILGNKGVQQTPYSLHTALMFQQVFFVIR